jgi:hypothetical protein
LLLEDVVRTATPATVFDQEGCSLATASSDADKLVKGAWVDIEVDAGEGAIADG